MKTKNILYAAFILTITIYGCGNTRDLKNDQPADSTSVKNMIDAKSFVFIPKFVNPVSGKRRDLSSGYEISISKDSIISYLPFLGRGYTAPISPSDVDFDFTSTNFTYASTVSKKGWTISIKPKDGINIQELYFRIFDNANASLNITSINRSSISYDGYITEREMYAKTKKQ